MATPLATNRLTGSASVEQTATHYRALDLDQVRRAQAAASLTEPSSRPRRVRENTPPAFVRRRRHPACDPVGTAGVAGDLDVHRDPPLRADSGLERRPCRRLLSCLRLAGQTARRPSEDGCGNP